MSHPPVDETFPLGNPDWEEGLEATDRSKAEDENLLDELEATDRSASAADAQNSGMSRQAIDRRRRKRALYERRRQQLNNTLLALALRDRDEAFKNKVYEIVIQTGLDSEDPAFLLMIATGRLELLLEESPKELEALFDQWSQRVYSQLQNYREGLEHYERSAVKAQEKAIAQSVHALIQKTAIDQLLHSFSAASIGIGAVLLLGAGAIGAVLGNAWTVWQQARVEYEAGSPRRLTLEEANLLKWATSREGQLARNLLAWNQNLLARDNSDRLVCEEDVSRLGVTLELEGRKAKAGFCTLWVHPLGDRRFEGR